MFNTQEVLCYICNEYADPWTAILVGVDAGSGDELWMHNEPCTDEAREEDRAWQQAQEVSNDA
jgi:hypothetical protein